MINFNVSDIIKYIYCPRILFYTYVQPLDKKTDHRQEVIYQQEIKNIPDDILEKLETKRKLKRYHLQEGEGVFHSCLTSSGLGLKGKPDLIIKCKEGIFPVEFKYTISKSEINQLYQLGAYALLLEELYGLVVTKGFLYVIPSCDVEVFTLSPIIKNKVLEILSFLNQMVKKELIPEQTKERDRCINCEYQNFCGDVW